MMTACGGPSRSESSGTTPTTLSDDTGAADSGSTESGAPVDTTQASAATTSGEDATTTDGVKFDLGRDDESTTGEPPVEVCHVVDDMDAVGECGTQAPADSFDPEIQWAWTGPEGEVSIVPALVANLTDDNGDGAIDLCDVPDVVVVAGPMAYGPANIWVLDGATGAEHFRIRHDVDPTVTPALGDIDGDGAVEIVAATPGGILNAPTNPSYLVAFEHTGEVAWQSATPIDHGQGFAIALADLDADGDVEIVADDTVLDHHGLALWTAPTQEGWVEFDLWHATATAIADLDGDGIQEVVLGQTAYTAEGDLYYDVPDLEPGFPQIANLDDDDEPEILVTTRAGATVLEHDGSVKLRDQTPTGDPYGAWFRPATVHDFDGDDLAEVALSSASHYSVVERDLSIVWTADVDDDSGWSAGTAFDFLGDGVAEAMYTDERQLHVFDGNAASLLELDRSSPTLIEYPTVVDVDNDGSAEILVVSWGVGAPALQVIRDADDRWIQARRIWNQHTYHVTNVREDGTIPQHETPSWQSLNTYRTNAQIEGGGVCKPEPAG